MDNAVDALTPQAPQTAAGQEKALAQGAAEFTMANPIAKQAALTYAHMLANAGEAS